MALPFPAGSARPGWFSRLTDRQLPAPSPESLRTTAANLRFAYDSEWQRMASPEQRRAANEVREAFDLAMGEWTGPVRIGPQVLNAVYPAAVLMANPHSREHHDLDDCTPAELQQQLELLRFRLQMQDLWDRSYGHATIDPWLNERLKTLLRRIAA